MPSSVRWMAEALALFARALFCPSRWRTTLQRAAPDLPPDFSLAQLDRETLRSPGLRHLLRQLAAGGLALIAASTFGGLWLSGAEGSHMWVAAAYGLGLGVSGTLMTASGVSVIGAAWGGVFISAAFGFSCAHALHATGGVAGLAEALTVLDATTRLVGGLPAAQTPSPVVGASISIAIGIAGSMAAAVSPEPRSPAGRQVGAAVVGILTCIATHGGAVLVLLFVSAGSGRMMAAAGSFGVLVFVAVSVAYRLHGRSAAESVRTGGIAGAAFAVVVAAAANVREPVLQLVVGGAATGIFYSALFVLAFVLAAALGGRWAGAVASAVGSGTAFMLFAIARDGQLSWAMLPLSLAANAFGLLLPLWLPIVMYPLEMAANILLFRAESVRPPAAPTLIHGHSAFWHERQWLPLRGLDAHLRLLWERDAQRGEAAIERIATSPQRWAAHAARVEIDARALEACADAEAIAVVATRLATVAVDSPTSATLRHFLHVADRMSVALAQGSLSDRDVHLAGIERTLDDLAQDLTRGAALAERFLPIARRWRDIVRADREILRDRLATRQEIRNPYVRGMPLTEEQDVFVGRAAVCGQIAHVLLNQEPTALMLYGQRRMGKTSLLNRLGRLLPAEVVPLFVDLQGVARARTVDGLLFGICRSMVDSARRHRGLTLEGLSRDALVGDPFVAFDVWLDALERGLGGAVGLLALDEFEALDSAFGMQRFYERDVLGMLRQIIQHRRRLRVLLAGSHTLDEVGRWATYLVNVQAIHLRYLNEDEARQLVERPVAGFPLCYEPEASRRVLDLTSCHPNLVQLLCYHIVARKNLQPVRRRHTVTVPDVEAAVPDVLTSGAMLFIDMATQAGTQGVALLARIAAAGEGAVTHRAALAAGIPDALAEESLIRLVRLETLESVPGGYRFQIELVRRWFAGAGEAAGMDQRPPNPW